MTNRVVTTANGKTIDFGALQLKNETVKAVGNLGVNARGDKIEKQRVVQTRSKVIQGQHKRQTTVVNTLSAAEKKRQKEREQQEKLNPIDSFEPALKLNIDLSIPVEDLTAITLEQQMSAVDVSTTIETQIATENEIKIIEEFDNDDQRPLTGLAAALAKVKK